MASNDYTVCPECNFGALEYQFKKTKGVCPKCKAYNVLKDKPVDATEQAFMLEYEPVKRVNGVEVN